MLTLVKNTLLTLENGLQVIYIAYHSLNNYHLDPQVRVDCGLWIEISMLVLKCIGYKDTYDHVVSFKKITWAYEPITNV